MNDLVKNENGVIVDTPNNQQNFNRNLGNNVIKISVKTKKFVNKKTGKPFNSIKGLKHITVLAGEDKENAGADLGRKNVWLDVHFLADAFKTEKGEYCTITDANDITTGYLYVLAKYIQSPSKYQVKFERDKQTDEIVYKDGKAVLKYPEIWIKGGIMGFEPYVSTQDEFDYQTPDMDAEFEEVEESTDVQPEEEDTDEIKM